ncbi:DUF4258 domain-containing protein [Candidatus Woesearchaeota archaeon]|nr:DUF4258 domain-containing protein [Candidatus Woesearchaeota archaeon]
MDIRYTQHAREQIEERRIHPIWVEETITSPDETKRTGHKFFATKKLNGNALKVVYVKENYIKVITVYFIS